MVPVDVDGQICHFCSQGFVTRNKSVTSMESSSSLLSLSSCSFYSPSSSTLLLSLILSLSLASSSFYSSSSTSSLLSFSNPSFNSYSSNPHLLIHNIQKKSKEIQSVFPRNTCQVGNANTKSADDDYDNLQTQLLEGSPSRWQEEEQTKPVFSRFFDFLKFCMTSCILYLYLYLPLYLCICLFANLLYF